MYNMIIIIYFPEALKHTFLYQDYLLTFIYSMKIGLFDAIFLEMQTSNSNS
jgi:hypothetical protein